jgi:hypothetical protein
LKWNINDDELIKELLLLAFQLQVRMVSQGAQTNGMNGKKLTKSYSEIGSGVADASCQYDEDKR